MGDRTYVNLTVLTAQADAARAIFDDEASEESTDGHLTVFGFEEVNYGNLGFETDLGDAGIAFDKRWEAGDEYTAGTQHVRFRPDGTLQNIEVYDEGANPELDRLLALCDKPDELVRYIRGFKDEVTPLPWDHQIEYGQLYVTNQSEETAP